MLAETAATVLQRIEAARIEAPDGVLAFDGDGTLWSGDVGDDLLDRMLEEDVFRPEAAGRLHAEREAHGLPSSSSSARDAARALRDAERRGAFPEISLFELVAWALAGFTRVESAAFAERVLARGALRDRFQAECVEVLQHAQAIGIDVFLVSASPRAIAEPAASMLGIGPDRVVATTPRFRGDTTLAEVERPIPYADGKVTGLAARTGGRPIVAAFGDSYFDAAMLRAARIPVAVRPKARLRDAAGEVPGMVLLAPSDGAERG